LVLALLILATSLAVATVSVWLVVPYLLLMAWMVLTPSGGATERARHPSAPSGAAPPDRSVEAVLLLKTYHEVARPVLLLKNARRAMLPGARLGVIDRGGKGDDHGVEADAVVKEAGRAGFKLVEQYDFVKPDGMDYFLVFQASE
jgi:hypothetical protein